jgi:hypothetical protein
MPNVLDADPMRDFARRVGAKIGDEKIAARFEKLAFERLLEDMRNFREALPGEIETGPGWARAAAARGETVSVFRLHRGAASRLHMLARRLADTCRVAATDDATRPRDLAAIRAARDFLDKFNRASFEAATRKALGFSRLLATWASDADEKPVCEDASAPATQGRVWRRVRSVGALRAVGREFRNCLARTTRGGGYGGMLLQGVAQFWVLRAPDGTGLIVAMAPAPAPACFTEVRGPRNAPVSSEQIDLMRLAVALGMGPNDPPPPPAAAAARAPLRRRPAQFERALALAAG